MAFPRNFKKQVWYLRIPSGEIEVATSDALQRAFQCGLVDVRTPVRAFGTVEWKTMQEAASIEVPPEPTLASLSPVALDDADLDETSVWQSRGEVDPETFKHSRRPAFVAFVACAAFVAAAIFGRGKLMEKANAHAAAATLARQSVTPVTLATTIPKGSPPPIREQLHTMNGDDRKFSKEQLRRLAELDYVTRTQRPKSAVMKPLLPPKAPPAEDPFVHGGAARTGDPLDGTL